MAVARTSTDGIIATKKLELKFLSSMTRQPFAIANLLGKRYACPGWFPIGDDVQVSDLPNMDFGIKKEPKPVIKQPEKIEQLVTGSDGKKQYTVKFNGMYWSCTCVGFGFRRHCRHIQQVKDATRK
jgi:hypothetical protein